MLGIYEGIGRILGIATYILISLFALIGGLIFWYKKKISWAFWWLSAMANIFAFLYLLGGYGDFVYMMQIVAMIAWPIINIAWLLDLIIDLRIIT